VKPWEARQQKRGVWGFLYRWFYGERHREKIREQLAQRRQGTTKSPRPGGGQDGAAVREGDC
jgi:hypothetical protein